MDIIALLDAAGEPLARLRALVGDDDAGAAAAHTLAHIGSAIRGRAHTMLPLLDAAHARLALVEQQGGYGDAPPEVDSESASGRVLAQLVGMHVDTLARSTSPAERRSARNALHALFDEHGAALLGRRVSGRMAPGVLFAARRAYQVWEQHRALAAEAGR